MSARLLNVKKVLITGSTGFKGSWLSVWLSFLGADVLGFALAPQTNPSMYSVLNLDEKIKTVIGDILDAELLEKTFNDFKPEFVFHLAAQPLVRYSYEEPILTYKTNVIGSLNVLEAARKCGSVKAFVNVTTDKCYENVEKSTGYKEDEPMGGYDMYSSSKGCVEILSSSYRRSFLKPEQKNSFPLDLSMLNCLEISSFFSLNICGFFFLKSLNISNVSLLSNTYSIFPEKSSPSHGLYFSKSEYSFPFLFFDIPYNILTIKFNMVDFPVSF